MKLSRFFTLICVALVLCSCDKDEFDVIDTGYDPESYVWQKQTFAPFSYCPGIGPSTDRISDVQYRFDGAPYQGEELSWASIGKNLLTGAASGVGSFLAGQAMSAVFGAFIESDEQKIMNALDGISNELNNLKSLAYDILDKLDEMEMNDLIR